MGYLPVAENINTRHPMSKFIHRQVKNLLQLNHQSTNIPTFRKPDKPFDLLKDRHGSVMGVYGGMEYARHEMQMAPG